MNSYSVDCEVNAGLVGCCVIHVLVPWRQSFLGVFFPILWLCFIMYISWFSFLVHSVFSAELWNRCTFAVTNVPSKLCACACGTQVVRRAHTRKLGAT